MRRLILMRHAKTEAWSEGIDDFGRALVKRGFTDALRMGQEIVARGWSPDLILVSSARRARETCAEVAKVVEDERVRPMESLYLSGLRGIVDVVSKNEATDTLMLVGHNPGMHDFSLSILKEGGSLDHHASLRLSEKFPTGCAALFAAEDDGPFVFAHFKLFDVIRPKDLRGRYEGE